MFGSTPEGGSSLGSGAVARFGRRVGDVTHLAQQRGCSLETGRQRGMLDDTDDSSYDTGSYDEERVPDQKLASSPSSPVSLF